MKINMRKIAAWLVIFAIVFVIEFVLYLIGGMAAALVISATVVFAFVACSVTYLVACAIYWAIEIISEDD